MLFLQKNYLFLILGMYMGIRGVRDKFQCPQREEEFYVPRVGVKNI